jgi:hypothetical protein
VEKAKRILHFAQTAKVKFDMGGLNEKREILTELDSNFSLLDGILHLDVAPHYVMLQNLQPAVANDIVRLEQSENSNGTTKNTDQKSAILIWLPRLLAIQRFFMNAC